MLLSEVLLLAQLMTAGQVTPGPNNALLSSSGMRFGYRATQPHAWGILCGHAFLEFAVALGLGTIYAQFPFIERILTFVAVLLIIYLAYKIAMAPVDRLATIDGHDKPWTFWQGFAFQWINPKVWFIAMGIAGQFASGTDPLKAAMIIGAVTASTAIISTQTWTIFGVAMRQVLNTPLRRRLFNIAMASLMVISVIAMLQDH